MVTHGPTRAQEGDVSVQNATFAFNYELDKGEKELGSGQFSVVRRARRKKDGVLVAVKCIEKASLTEEDLQVGAGGKRGAGGAGHHPVGCLPGERGICARARGGCDMGVAGRVCVRRTWRARPLECERWGRHVHARAPRRRSSWR